MWRERGDETPGAQKRGLVGILGQNPGVGMSAACQGPEKGGWCQKGRGLV